MKVPGIVAEPVPQVDLPSPTMFAMAAAIMDQHGKFDPSTLLKLDVESRRDVEERAKRHPDAPQGKTLGPDNEYVPSNRGLLAPWNRRT